MLSRIANWFNAIVWSLAFLLLIAAAIMGTVPWKTAITTIVLVLFAGACLAPSR